METINHILASFDLMSILSAIFPSVVNSFEKGFMMIYDTVFTRLIEVFEKMPFLLPLVLFFAFYGVVTSIISYRKSIRIRS